MQIAVHIESLEQYLEYTILSTYLLLPPGLLTGFMPTDWACSVSQLTSHESDQTVCSSQA